MHDHHSVDQTGLFIHQIGQEQKVLREIYPSIIWNLWFVAMWVDLRYKTGHHTTTKIINLTSPSNHVLFLRILSQVLSSLYAVCF